MKHEIRTLDEDIRELEIKVKEKMVEAKNLELLMKERKEKKSFEELQQEHNRLLKSVEDKKIKLESIQNRKQTPEKVHNTFY